MATRKLYIVGPVGNGAYVLLNTGRIVPRAQARGLTTGPATAASVRAARQMAQGGMKISKELLTTSGMRLPRYIPNEGDNNLENMTSPVTGNFWDNATPLVKKDHAPAETRATQQFLKNKGYNIAVDGKWGPQTESAAQNWRSTRNPTIWNRSVNATPSTRPSFTPTKTAPPVAGNQGPARPPDTGSAGVGGGAGGGPGTSPPTSLLGGKVPQWQNIPASWASLGTGGLPLSMVPDNSADRIDPATAQSQMAQAYAPLFQALQAQIDVMPATTAQHLADIASWYGQVQTAVGGASEASVKSQKAASEAITNSTKSIMDSIGGSANAGANMVGAEGAAQAGYANQLGQIDQDFLAKMGPILQAGQASASLQEQGRQQAIARDLAVQLAQVKAQAGQSEFEKMLQIAQYNHGLQQEQFTNQLGVRQYNQQAQGQRLTNMLGIRSANAQGAQQGFANQLALAGLQLQQGQFGLQTADTVSTIQTRTQEAADRAAQTRAGIDLQYRNSQIQQANAMIKTNQAAQTAQANGWRAAQATAGLTGDGRVPHGGLQPIVSAIIGATAGLPTAIRRQVVKANLLSLKNEKGQPLLHLSAITPWLNGIQ